MNNIEKLAEPTEAEYLEHAEQEELLLFASKDDYLAIANGVWELFVKRAKAYAQQQTEPVAYDKNKIRADVMSKSPNSICKAIDLTMQAMESIPHPPATAQQQTEPVAYRGTHSTLLANNDWTYGDSEAELKEFGCDVIEPVFTHPPATVPLEWEKLKDPNVLHTNLLRGFPAKLSDEQLLHLLGSEHEVNQRVPLEKYNKLLDALKKIACESQDYDLLWWQIEARQAIAEAEEKV